MFHRIDHRFTMALPPDRAQDVFNEDVASELARQDELKIVREEPGLIVFNSDVWTPEQWEFAEAPPARWDAPAPGGSEGRGLRVEFRAEDGATAVRIRGHAEKSVREALVLLGTPGHWPEGRIAGG